MQHTSIRALKAFLPATAWAVVIFFLSSQQVLPGFETSFLDFLFKKFAHMFVYFILYLLLFYGFAQIHTPPNSKKVASEKVWLFALITCMMYAISDEIHQSLVPGRQPTIRDIGYDFLGMSLAMLLRLKYI